MPTLFVASPLDDETVADLRSLDPGLSVIHEKDLLPAPRFPADHRGGVRVHADAGDAAPLA